MANKVNKEINQLGQDIHELITNQHIDTFKSNPSNTLDLDGIQVKAYESLKDITRNNMDEIGKGSYSQVINRLSNLRGSKGVDGKSGRFTDEIKNLFNGFDEKSVAESLMNSGELKNIIEYDAEIDTICDYMPILEEALDAKKDGVLSADQFNKDFLMIRNIVDDDTSDRIKSMKDNYGLVEKAETWFYQTSKYGETYVYIAPYNEEVKKLYENKKNINIAKSTNENAVPILEQYNKGFQEAAAVHEHLSYNINESESFNLDLNINYSSILDSAVEEYISLESMIQYTNKIESQYAIISEAGGKSKSSDKNKSSNSSSLPKATLKTVPGAIVKTLDRSRLLPLDVNKDFRFGYLYVEVDDYAANLMTSQHSAFKSNSIDMTLTNATAGVGFGNMQKKSTNTDILNNIANSIAERITPKFIVNNQDIKYELYNILNQAYGKGSNGMGVNISFLPAHTVEHIYWKKDANGRGISELSKSLIPARLYISLYTCNTIGILTRGFDRRAYYVKNNIDTNISQNMMSVINAIKANNKGMRDFNSIKNIIQTSGIYNDLLIPMTKNGESPIEFSIMEGQNIDTKESLLEQFESMAVSPIGVPYEYLMSRKSVDYAIRLTMANGKFLKECYKRQGVYEKFLTRIHNKIYNYEYNNDDILETKLPPPAYLSILNANQMIDNSKALIESIVDIVNVDKEEVSEVVLNQLKLILAKEMLSGYIDFDKAEENFNTAKVLKSPANGDNADEDSGGDYQ